jgi:hypothetical protein
MAAVLTNGKGFYHPLVYALESHRLGLKLLPPSVNEPGPAFVPHGRAIRVPLTCMKGLTSHTTDAILDGLLGRLFCFVQFALLEQAAGGDNQLVIARTGIGLLRMDAEAAKQKAHEKKHGKRLNRRSRRKRRLKKVSTLRCIC